MTQSAPITIVFETHATSVDNEARIASGWHDADLSVEGEAQARALGERRRTQALAAVYCSDLRRPRRTAEIAFGDRRYRSFPIVEGSGCWDGPVELRLVPRHVTRRELRHLLHR